MKKVFFSLMSILLILSLSGCKTEESELINGYYGPKSPEVEKEFGDIVFKDGSALPFTPNMTLSKAQKKYAIAVIFYKGTELNSGTDTTTVRTLGIGLKHSKERLSWCTSDADAVDVRIEALVYEKAGAQEDYKFRGYINGSDALEKMKNTSGIDDTQNPEKYPAFYFAKKYSETETKLKGTPYEDGWYLPTYAEYVNIFLGMYDGDGVNSNKGYVDIDYISGLCGGSKFSETEGTYWTSNQSFTHPKCAVDCRIIPFGSCYALNVIKGDEGLAKACAIREF